MDKKRYYILEKIIDRYENSKNDWRGETSENRSFPIQQSDFDACGRSELLEEARELEQLVSRSRGRANKDLSKLAAQLRQVMEKWDA